MAIYHLAAQVISRGAGRNAVNAAAYRRGARMHDERTGETFSYVHKRDVLHSEITIPDDAPSWVKAILERHALVLGTRQLAHTDIAALLRHQTVEARPGHEIHDLRKQRPANVHGCAPDWKNRDKYRGISNRVQIDTKPIRR